MPVFYQGDWPVGIASRIDERTTAANGTSTCAAKNLTGATVYLLLRKPGGTVVEFEAEITSASRGEVRYVTSSADDLDETGPYTYQWRVEPATGQAIHTSTGSFTVEAPLVATA